MASQIHVLNRNGIYYFRRRVPKDLLSLYPSSQIIFSLKTKDRKEADRLARIESVKLDQEFQRQRSELCTHSSGELSEEDIKHICELWIASVLEEDEEYRMEGLTDREYRKYTESLNIADAGGRYDFAKGDTKLIEFEMEDFCESHGFNIVKGSLAYRRLAYAFLRADVEAMQKVLARHRGGIVETPQVPPLGSQHRGLTLSQVLDRWKLEANPKPKTIAEWELVISRFNTLHGVLPIAKITKAHVVAFKDTRLLAGSASATVTKQLGALSSLLQYSVGNDLITTNVASGVRVARNKVEKKTRLPYEIDDLNRIFSCPIYTIGERPQGGGGEAAYWLPLLALYTGARLEELGQLRRKDIKESDGLWYISITDEAEGASLKTHSSRRALPIHPELSRLGFVDYAHTQREKLFPGLKVDSHKSLTGNFSKWWGRYARKVIAIEDERKVFHSFRHAFKDACRNSGIHQEIHDAFTGHAGSNVGSTYGSGASLTRLAQEMVTCYRFL
ncbi:MAG: tyrosine-type recombinase/integrase [Nitrosospira sp.]|nr:tyrosine-type recombinase/integrase [Nitrosospira sp.]